jgi:hypothetical protein
MPLPVDIDVGDANASPASHIAPTAGGHLKVVQPHQAGRPAQRAAEDAWLAPHRLQEVPQPTRVAGALAHRRVARADELPFWAWVLGLVSILAIVLGFLVLWVGAAFAHNPLIEFGAWTTGAGVIGFLFLVLRSDRL